MGKAPDGEKAQRGGGLHLWGWLQQGGRALDIQQGRAQFLAVLKHCLLGRGQRGNNEAYMLISSALSNGVRLGVSPIAATIIVHSQI